MRPAAPIVADKAAEDAPAICMPEDAVASGMRAGRHSGNGEDDMTVKAKRGRRRYIAFAVDPRFTKDALIAAFRRAGTLQPYVIQCAEGWAILRCSPNDTDETISAMKAADGSSISLRTSGTLAKLRSLYPELKRLRPVRRTAMARENTGVHRTP